MLDFGDSVHVAAAIRRALFVEPPSTQVKTGLMTDLFGKLGLTTKGPPIGHTCDQYVDRR